MFVPRPLAWRRFGIATEPGREKTPDPIVSSSHRGWIEEALEGGLAVRDGRWSEAVAVGSLAFAEQVKSELGVKARHRDIKPVDGTYALRERSEPYGAENALEKGGSKLGKHHCIGIIG
jgi:hypothetical protein